MAKTASRQIVITGVSRGLGRAMAEGFIERGHTVHGCARSEKAVAELRKAFSGAHTFEALDVRDDAAVAAWAKRVLDSVGAPDLLLNNAALVNRNAVLWNVPAREFSDVIVVTVKGVVNVIRGFVPSMVARKRGASVTFSSV